ELLSLRAQASRASREDECLVLGNRRQIRAELIERDIDRSGQGLFLERRRRTPVHKQDFSSGRELFFELIGGFLLSAGGPLLVRIHRIPRLLLCNRQRSSE